MPFLRYLNLSPSADERTGYPFSVPALRNLACLELDSPVTFFVGENGSGKSTLLEAIALKAKLPSATGTPLELDETIEAVKPLAGAMTLAWRLRTRFGFYLRAEDFFNFARQLKERAKGLDRLVEQHADDPRVAGYMAAQRHALDSRYGEDLHQLSHGESFLKFFQSRMSDSGLYLIDEPEAALSPQRQLSFLYLLKGVVDCNAQFIIATHSPILLAFPGARILTFDEDGVRPVEFEALEHVTITRNFLADPARFFRHFDDARNDD